MNKVTLHDGPTLPALGLGTWRLGESARRRTAEVAAVRLALRLGYRVVDTAEMYGEGGAEEVVGQAFAEAIAAGEVRREDVFVVSKVYPHNASRAGAVAACRRSLQRLGLRQLDLYLLHWRGQHPLRDTVAAFEALVAEGLIRHWGVSNFDIADMQELLALPQGARCAVDQVYYALSERGPEVALLPWLRRHGIACMAYSPIDQGKLAGDAALAAIGQRRGASAAQVALAWALRQPGVMAIPKAVREDHLRENLAAADVELDDADVDELERRFPRPRGKAPLAMI